MTEVVKTEEIKIDPKTGKRILPVVNIEVIPEKVVL